MSAPIRALAWKEARDLAMPVGACVAVLVVAHAAVPAAHAPLWAEAFVMLFAPAAAAMFGAVSIAGENAGGGGAFLRARAVGVATILRVKLAAHGIATLVVAALSFVLAARADLGGAAGWSRALAAPSQAAWLLGAVLVATFFTAGVALSLVLPDGLTAAPAAMIAGGAWCVLVLLPGARLAASTEVGLGGLLLMTPLLLLLPAIVAWRLARRDAWLRSGPTSPATKIAMLGLGVVAAAGFVVAIQEPLRARAVRMGQAVVAEDVVVSTPRGDAVAFVATPEGGAARAVIALVDRRRTLQVSVLPPGTRPLGWSGADDAYLVAWPGGAVRAVTVSGDIRDAAPERSVRRLGAGDSGAFRVSGGRLVRSGTQGGSDEVLYPPSREVIP